MYLYISTYISHPFVVAVFRICTVNPQLPDGTFVNPGTPLSVAKVLNVPVAPAAKVKFCVVCPVIVGFGLSCLYVGLPIADEVFNDKFIQNI